MSRLRHGYTNRTRRLPWGRVEKQYDGPDGRVRLEREHACLTHLTGRLPLPEVLGIDRSGPTLTLREVPGDHGQDLLDAGHAEEVLREVGNLLAGLRAIETAVVPGLTGTGDVIVHGDFGPQNLLIDHGEVTALLDWEFAHRGQPVEDLAWAEWIVRMHHPSHRCAIPELLGAAQLDTDWASRHSAMVARCSDLHRGVERSGPPDAVELWHERLRLTETWTE
jgi:aminoglycoside phosphotransferase